MSNETELKDCINRGCWNHGWYIGYGHDGEPVQIQCEYCYTEKLSVFNHFKGDLDKVDEWNTRALLKTACVELGV